MTYNLLQALFSSTYVFLSPRLSDTTRMAQVLGSMWDRALGKSDVLTICDEVFEELADRNTNLLGVNFLHVATLRVYDSINKTLPGPHKDPPRLWLVTEKMERYRAEKTDGISQEEFQKLIMEWVRQEDLLLVLADKAMLGVLVAPALLITTLKASSKVPRIRDVVVKVPVALLITVFSVGVMLM